MIEVAHIVARVTTDLTRFNAGMAAAETRAKTATAKMSLAGARMSKYLTLPLLGVGYVAVKSAFHFTDAMSQIQYGAGASRKEMQGMTKEILRMAQNSTVGPNELAKGLYHVESLGYRGKKALNILNAARLGAQLGMADLEQTTSALGGAMRAFSLQGKDANKTMALMKATVGAGNMRFDDLTHALGTGVLPVARLAGLTIKDVMASMTVFTDENQNAASSMTRLRTALMMMQNPSKKAQGAMEALGFSGLKIGKMIRTKGWIATIEMLKKSMNDFISKHGGNKFAKALAFKELSSAFGGSKTASQVMLLINQADLLKMKYNQIGHTVSKFDRNVKDSNELVTNQLRKGWSNVQVALIDFGETAMPLVVGFTKELAKFATWFHGQPQYMRKAIMGIALGLMVLGPSLIVLSSLIKLTKDVGLALKGLRVVMLGTEAASGGFKAGLLRNMVTPMGLVVTAAFAAAAAMIYFRNQAKAAMDAADEANSRVGTNTAAALSYYAERVKFYEHHGHSAAESRALATRDTRGHTGNHTFTTGHGGKRALGGPVRAGMSYLVGEKGPEMFTPGKSGQITPNHALAGGPTVNVENMHVRSEEDIYAIASVMGRRLSFA